MLNLIRTSTNSNTIYSQLQVVWKLNQNFVDGVIITFAILVAVMAIMWIYSKTRREKLNLRKEEQSAVRQNELNADNTINKIKMLDD